MHEQTARRETSLCVVDRTVFVDGTLVSTVFLGLNHNVTGPPVLFETKIFDPDGVAWPYRRTPIAPTMGLAQAIYGLGHTCMRSGEDRTTAIRRPSVRRSA